MAELNIQYPDYPRSDLMARQANALDQAYASRQQEMSDVQATKNALSGMTSMEDIKSILPALMKANPQLGINAMQHVATMDAARRKSATEEATRLASSLVQLDDETASRLYPQVALQYKSKYPEYASQVPAQWDRPMFQQLAGMGISPEASMRNQTARDAYGLQRDKFEYDKQSVPILDAKGNAVGSTSPKSKILPQPKSGQMVEMFNKKEGRSIKVSPAEAGQLQMRDPSWVQGKPIADHELSDASVAQNIRELTGYDAQESSKQWADYLALKKSGTGSNEAWSKVQSNYGQRQAELDGVKEALKGKPGDQYDIKVDGVVKRFNWDGSKIIP